jgi:hypothetical protein
MTGKRRKLEGEKFKLSQRQLIAISVALSLTIVLTFIIVSLHSTDIPFSLNAAIIDQLSRDAPNPTFVAKATEILMSKNFKVSYYNENLDVAFFRKLTAGNYGIILLRVHSALRKNDNPTVDLFTTEPYTPGKYSQEIKDELIVIGNYSFDPSQFYYAITYKFIKSLQGRLPKSIVIAMGCWSLKERCEQLANAFIEKGAKAYIGWTDEIKSEHTDNETLKLLNMLLKDDYPLGYAISKTTTYNYTGVLPDGRKIEIKSRLRLFPDSPEVNSLKLSELIAEANKASTYSIINNFKTTDMLFKQKPDKRLLIYIDLVSFAPFNVSRNYCI